MVVIPMELIVLQQVLLQFLLLAEVGVEEEAEVLLAEQIALEELVVEMDVEDIVEILLREHAHLERFVHLLESVFQIQQQKLPRLWLLLEI